MKIIILTLLFAFSFARNIKKSTSNSNIKDDEIVVQSPCLTDMRAENYGYFGEQGLAGQYVEIAHECYGELQHNYTVMSISSEAFCYIPEQHFYQ